MWVVCGEFNEVRYPEERRGSVFHARGAREFNKFIDEADLKEPSLGVESLHGPGRTAQKPVSWIGFLEWLLYHEFTLNTVLSC